MQRRILFLITDLQIGGTPTVVRELAVRLHNPPNVQIEVACLSAWGPTASQISEREIHVTALNANGAWDFAVIGRLNRLIRHGNYDTVMSFLIHANTAAALAKLRHHNLRCIQSIQTTQPYPQWHWLLQHLVQIGARKIVVPSESAKDAAVQRSDIPSKKIVVIPNAIDPDEFPRSLIPAQQPSPYPIGFIGRLDPVKQIPLLIHEFFLLSQRRNVMLYIFGDGEDRQRIMSEIGRFGLENRVVMHGAVAKPQAALEQIGMLILPSAAEGFGLVLIEAMAAGVPIIANNAPGIRDVIRNNQTGWLVNVTNPNELATAMEKLIDDQSLRQRLIETGINEVHEKFSWSKTLPAYRELLQLE